MMHLVSTGPRPAAAVSGRRGAEFASRPGGLGSGAARWLRRLLALCTGGLRGGGAAGPQGPGRRSFTPLDGLAFSVRPPRPRTPCPRRRRV
jgi:hypothetical protein